MSAQPFTRCRWWLVVLALAGIAAPAAHADNKTYCVGGFELDGFSATRQQCKLHEDIHPRWHFHNHVRGPDGKCRECWDEEDATCVSRFLVDHREFVAINEWECWRSGALPPSGEEIRLEKGEVIKTAPPPPPVPVDVRAEIVRISAGPHAVGDKVTVDVRVVGPDGQARAVQGGEIILKGPDGTERLRVPVRPGPAGATAEMTVPVGGNLALAFVPGGIALSANEKLGSVQPQTTALSVSPCRLRGTVLLPHADEVVAADSTLALRGQLREHGGAAAGASALSPGTQAVFVIELASGKTQEAAAVVDAAGVATASARLPAPAGDSEAIAIRLLGKQGSSDFCPDLPVEVRLTRLGVGIDVLAPLPEASCYVGRPCQVTARFRLPTQSSAKSIADAFVGDPALQVTAALNQEPIGKLLAGRAADGHTDYSLKFTPQLARKSELVITASAGSHQISERVRLRIRLPLVLKLPAVLDFGVIAAGKARSQNCQTLDFSESSGIEEQPLALRAQLVQGCRSTLYIVDRQGRFFDLGQERSTTLGLQRAVRLCLEVPRCAGDSPPPAMLTAQAQSPDFPAERAAVQLRWQVSSRSFVSCHWWWIALLSGALLVLFIAYGFIRPAHFSVEDGVKIATKQPALQRAVARRLRDLPGGKAGFYRSASTGLREDGSATNHTRTALLVFTAVPGDIVLYCRGALQRYNPQTRKLDDVAVGKSGYPVAKNTIYCVGTLYFQVT